MWGSVVGEDGTEIGHSWGQDQLLQTRREETELSLEQQQFLAVATLGFINIIPLLLDLVYHNCILFDFTDVNNNHKGCSKKNLNFFSCGLFVSYMNTSVIVLLFIA